MKSAPLKVPVVNLKLSKQDRYCFCILRGVDMNFNHEHNHQSRRYEKKHFQYGKHGSCIGCPSSLNQHFIA